MATQVPYTGAPSVAPTDAPIPSRSTDTPLAAFGGAVAQATSHLGEVAQGAGNELYARATAMQQLNEDAAANKAQADLTTGLATEFAKFASLEGKAKVDAFPKYQQNVNDMREQIRSTLTSPYAQKAYDQESRNNISRTMFAAAREAGDANKTYLVGSAMDKATADANNAGMHPEDEGAYQQSVRTKAETGK